MLSPEQKLELKAEALRDAVGAFSGSDLMDLKHGETAEETYTRGADAILKTARRFYGWLTGSASLALLAGPIVSEPSTTDEPKVPVAEGETVQINTGEKFSVAIDTRDASGYPTDATVVWSVADELVATVVLDEGNDQAGWVISGAPGSTVLTVTVTDVEPPLVATLAVDVVPAGTATVQITAGPAVPETAPQPDALVVTVAEDTTDLTRMTVLVTADNKGEGAVTVQVGAEGVVLPNEGDNIGVTAYSYAEPGTYSITVTDDDNPTRTSTQAVTVPFTA